ncbi:MAG: hypothetical protein WAK55_09980 [Xanthobacteraceae bacterium]
MTFKQIGEAAAKVVQKLDPDAWYEHRDFPLFGLPLYSKPHVKRLEDSGRWAPPRKFGEGKSSRKFYRGRHLIALANGTYTPDNKS